MLALELENNLPRLGDHTIAQSVSYLEHKDFALPNMAEILLSLPLESALVVPLACPAACNSETVLQHQRLQALEEIPKAPKQVPPSLRREVRPQLGPSQAPEQVQINSMRRCE